MNQNAASNETIDNEITNNSTNFNIINLVENNKLVQLKGDLDKLQIKLDGLKFRRFQLFVEFEKVDKVYKSQIVEYKKLLKEIHLLEKGVTTCPDLSKGKVSTEVVKDKRADEVKKMNFEEMVRSSKTLSELDRKRLLNCLVDLQGKLKD